MDRLLQICALGIVGLLHQTVAAGTEKTALDRYVAKPDNAYSYTQVGSKEDLAATTYFLSMTSQQWRSATEVDRPLWQHDLSITVPRGARLDRNPTAILFIDGGNNNTPTKKIDSSIQLLSLLTRSVIAVIRQVPNQPLQFFEESPPQARSEDALLAYGAQRYLSSCTPAGKGCNAEWLAHLAMVKSVVRGMDTVQTFLGQHVMSIDNFVLSGGSKRGWTTWLTAAVDQRVKGIIPISFDMLNIEAQIARGWAAYNGQYASALNDYAAPDIFCQAHRNPAGKRLMKLIDPYNYRQRLKMPKLIINSAGDQFFLPDASQLYFKDLPGDNRLRYTFNTDHSHNPMVKELLLHAIPWFNAIKSGNAPPSYEWEVRNGKLIVRTTAPVESVWLWQAVDARDPSKRDFRHQTLGPAWTKTPLQPAGTGRYEVSLPVSAPGTWTAQSIELVFQKKRHLLDPILPLFEEGSVFKDRQVYTTDVVIRPKRFPRPPQDHCGGSGGASP